MPGSLKIRDLRQQDQHNPMGYLQNKVDIHDRRPNVLIFLELVH